MKTLEIEIILMNYFDFTRNLIVPTVTPLSGLVKFETDLLVLTESGYATGIEIKVSRQDLKRDVKKKHWKSIENVFAKGNGSFEFYFGDFKYFFYAVPKKLENDALEQIPKFCGLFVIEENSISLVRGAKELFKTKWTFENKYKLARLGCLRIHKHKEKQLKNLK